MESGVKKKKVVKTIKVDLDKCIGCCSCEMACSAFHANPKYSSVNPARSRVRMCIDEWNDVFVPVRAADYTPAECAGRATYTIHGKEYSQCSFCGTSCPSRDYFKEPDSGLPLKCDMCEGEEIPLCVQVCKVNALTLDVTEEDVDEAEEVKLGDVEVGVEALFDKYGRQTVMDTVVRLSKKD